MLFYSVPKVYPVTADVGGVLAVLGVVAVASDTGHVTGHDGNATDMDVWATKKNALAAGTLTMFGASISTEFFFIIALHIKLFI